MRARMMIAAIAGVLIGTLGGPTGALATPVVAPSAYLGGPFSQATVDRFVADLATAGVGVYDPGTPRPLRAVRGGAGPVRLTIDQARTAAAGVSQHVGLSGATLDRLAPRVRLGRRLRVGLGAIVAGWAEHVQSRPARLARRILGKPDWRAYRRTVVPNAVVLLFAADTVRNLGHRSRALSRAGSFAAAPCTTAEGFVTGAIDQFFRSIGHVDLGPAVDRLFGSGFLGSVLKGIGVVLAAPVNATIDLAHRVLINGVKVPEQLVAGAIASVATVVNVVGSIAVALVPWTGRMTGAPNPISKGVGAGEPGALLLDVTAPGAVDWPPWLVDCAAHFGFALPDLAPKGADVTWDVSAQSPGALIIPGAASGALDDHGHAQLPFVTTTETPKRAEGAPAIGAVVAVATVHRHDLDQLRDRLTADLLASVPTLIRDLIGSQLRAVLAPMIESATSRITTVQDIQVAGVEAVRYHEPPDEQSTKRHRPPATTELHYGKLDACSLLTTADVAPVIQLFLAGPAAAPNACGWKSDPPPCCFAAPLAPPTLSSILLTAATAPNVASSIAAFKRIVSSALVPTPVAIHGLGDQAVYSLDATRSGVVYARVANAVVGMLVGPGFTANPNDGSWIPIRPDVLMQNSVSLMRTALSRLPRATRIPVKQRGS